MKIFDSNRFGVVLTATAIALIAGAQGLRAQDQTGRVADTDGIRQPAGGVAESRMPSSTPTSPGAANTSQPLETEGAEPPDCAKGFDLDKAYEDYLSRQRISMVSVAQADVTK